MWMWMVATYRRTHSPSWTAWFEVGGHLALRLCSSNEPGELLASALVINSYAAGVSALCILWTCSPVTDSFIVL